MGYKVGDMVVYPRHGAAKVEAITERTVKGVTREYLQLSVLSLTVWSSMFRWTTPKKSACATSSMPTRWRRSLRSCALRSSKRK